MSTNFLFLDLLRLPCAIAKSRAFPIMTMISDNLQRVRAQMQAACQAAGCDAAKVRLLAVSKTFGADAVWAAWRAGQCAFGENYIQEGVDKIAGLRRMAGGAATLQPLEWHCIGPVQSNKTRLVAEHFDWVQSIDRLKIAERLSAQRPPDLPPLQICLQVNIDGGANKSGVLPAGLPDLARQVAELPRLALRGLMCIPEPATDIAAVRGPFLAAKALFEQMRAAHPAVDTLSMGMSADLEAAIHCGSTMVRVGTAIFGRR
jgi:pyridoxal phosphate enzyme (YggS family)